MAHSSSGLGHHPLKVEIAGSNPACATVVYCRQYRALECLCCGAPVRCAIVSWQGDGIADGGLARGHGNLLDEEPDEGLGLRVIARVQIGAQVLGQVSTRCGVAAPGDCSPRPFCPGRRFTITSASGVTKGGGRKCCPPYAARSASAATGHRTWAASRCRPGAGWWTGPAAGWATAASVPDCTWSAPGPCGSEQPGSRRGLH